MIKLFGFNKEIFYINYLAITAIYNNGLQYGSIVQILSAGDGGKSTFLVNHTPDDIIALILNPSVPAPDPQNYTIDPLIIDPSPTIEPSPPPVEAPPPDETPVEEPVAPADTTS